ncbi:hypothetical protein NKG05_16820 [Oerskovia sp. M15]
MSVEEAQTVGDDVAVLGPDGATYGAPWVTADSTAAVRVNLTVTVPASEGIVEVRPPEVTLVRAGREIPARPAVEPDSEDSGTRLRGGALPASRGISTRTTAGRTSSPVTS